MKRGERKSTTGFILHVLLMLVMELGMLSLASTSARGSQPNIVFIMADDLGWADVGFHGGSAPTPHLDRLAGSALELTQHYVAPVCSPTRVGLLTGRYWSRFGITTPTNEQALPFDTRTLPGLLDQQGYDTCLVGKWHLGSLPRWRPNLFGFDHSYGSLAGGVTSWSHRYKQGPFTKTWHRNGELIEEEGHVTDLLTREAVQWIGHRGERPFFLYVPFTAVHLPINEPRQRVANVPARIEGTIERHYAACVTHLDDAVGAIVDALEQRGCRENTIVIFTSDNGGSTATNNTQPYPSDDSPEGRLPADNGEWRGQKASVYEGGTRVPTLVSWPGKVSSGKVDAPVCIVDWMPTLCRIVGIEPDSDLALDGVDILPLLTGQQETSDRDIYIAGPRWRQMSLRSGAWKLVTDGTDLAELYRIDRDPIESRNLADEEGHRVTAMLQRLQEIRKGDGKMAVRKSAER